MSSDPWLARGPPTSPSALAPPGPEVNEDSIDLNRRGAQPNAGRRGSGATVVLILPNGEEAGLNANAPKPHATAEGPSRGGVSSDPGSGLSAGTDYRVEQ